MAPNHRAWLAVFAFWMQDDEPCKTLLDIVDLPVSHTGDAMAEAFEGVLEDFGITEKVSLH